MGEGGKASCYCREQLALLYSKGKEAPHVIPAVATTPNPVHLWARAKKDSDIKLGSLINEESVGSDTSSAEL